jgi:DNA-binding NarL/FixJ family response regulator
MTPATRRLRERLGPSRGIHAGGIVERLRVLVIEGHPAVGRALGALLERAPDLELVGFARDGERGLRQALAERPDAALVDATLPGMSSCVVIQLLRTWLPRLRVIALGIYPEQRRGALAAGAHAFALKDEGYDALGAAIRGVDAPRCPRADAAQEQP